MSPSVRDCGMASPAASWRPTATLSTSTRRYCSFSRTGRCSVSDRTETRTRPRSTVRFVTCNASSRSWMVSTAVVVGSAAAGDTPARLR